MTPEQAALIASMVEGAPPREPLAAPAPPLDHSDEIDDGTELGPSDSDARQVDAGALIRCCELDHSDTDNGKRLLAHFGSELRVLKQGDAKTPSYAAWVGTHWDIDCGNLYAHAVAQKLGGRIGLEADVMAQTPFEEKIIAEADQADDDLAALEKRKAEWSDEDVARARVLKRLVDEGDAARDALKKRKIARRKFAVSSKNKSRIEAMMICAAPFCAVEPDDFNKNPFLFSTRKHTLEFVREKDLECPDPDVERMKVRLDVRDGHRREDMLTRFVPLAYKPKAECPRWLAFLDEFLPDASVREFVQTFSGLGLIGRTVQLLVFHYGSGANGKSVFLETLMRVLGPLAVGLPAESITGQGDRSAGGASPDLARLYGARALRVLELPADKPLHEDLVKKLTGGEKIPVRTLFKGYFEFTPIFSCHMSGNGYPRIDGTDNGIWRRMAVVHWPVTIPEEKRREFEDVLADFAPEYPGILNWLIEGATRFIESGLHMPDSVRAATAEYRSEMDPISDFIADCVSEAPGQYLTARTMYEAYVSWSMANAKKPIFETKFGRVMKTKFERTKTGVRRYLNCQLHDVPYRPDAEPRNPDWE
ncbi:phage/plasmid primase, P4 family [Methylocella tundrae]|uniref:DNA primase family protein n=1 Tax=Methylocella tundrae TaxID=227605 RepID=UPI0030FEDA0C|nr:phage/plasmid primase, P4 family [Methylocella tundrae]